MDFKKLKELKNLPESGKSNWPTLDEAKRRSKKIHAILRKLYKGHLTEYGLPEIGDFGDIEGLPKIISK